MSIAFFVSKSGLFGINPNFISGAAAVLATLVSQAILYRPSASISSSPPTQTILPAIPPTRTSPLPPSKTTPSSTVENDSPYILVVGGIVLVLAFAGTAAIMSARFKSCNKGSDSTGNGGDDFEDTDTNSIITSHDDISDSSPPGDGDGDNNEENQDDTDRPSDSDSEDIDEVEELLDEEDGDDDDEDIDEVDSFLNDDDDDDDDPPDDPPPPSSGTDTPKNNPPSRLSRFHLFLNWFLSFCNILAELMVYDPSISLCKRTLAAFSDDLRKLKRSLNEKWKQSRVLARRMMTKTPTDLVAPSCNHSPPALHPRADLEASTTKTNSLIKVFSIIVVNGWSIAATLKYRLRWKRARTIEVGADEIVVMDDGEDDESPATDAFESTCEGPVNPAAIPLPEDHEDDFNLALCVPLPDIDEREFDLSLCVTLPEDHEDDFNLALWVPLPDVDEREFSLPLSIPLPEDHEDDFNLALWVPLPDIDEREFDLPLCILLPEDHENDFNMSLWVPLPDVDEREFDLSLCVPLPEDDEDDFNMSLWVPLPEVQDCEFDLSLTTPLPEDDNDDFNMAYWTPLPADDGDAFDLTTTVEPAPVSPNLRTSVTSDVFNMPTPVEPPVELAPKATAPRQPSMDIVPYTPTFQPRTNTWQSNHQPSPLFTPRPIQRSCQPIPIDAPFTPHASTSLLQPVQLAQQSQAVIMVFSPSHSLQRPVMGLPANTALPPPIPSIPQQHHFSPYGNFNRSVSTRQHYNPNAGVVTPCPPRRQRPGRMMSRAMPYVRSESPPRPIAIIRPSPSFEERHRIETEREARRVREERSAARIEREKQRNEGWKRIQEERKARQEAREATERKRKAQMERKAVTRVVEVHSHEDSPQTSATVNDSISCIFHSGLQD